ncbi:radical SAM/SPASM domain-containing protein [Paenibacillus piscarius]|uniref:radical SAM/SPASM domain-containing protein n=1 Tax=Paenibacillus piscarius TaxID=1089681 RepID=UPI001EE9079D|nr:radical SAM protein [Paenibacillus piscarius]
MKLSKYNFKYKLNDDVQLIMNTLSGAVDLVEPKVARALFHSASDSLAGLDLETRTLLADRGYLSDKNEEQYIRDSLDTFYRSHPALTFTVCPTYTCNLACPYCFQSGIHQDSPTLTLTQVREMFQAMDQMVQKQPDTVVQFELFGGEPFLARNQPQVEYILQQAIDRNWPILSITNGTELGAYFPFLQKHSAHFHHMQITLDGPKEIHDQLRKYRDNSGSFDLICANITFLLEHHIPVTARINTGRENVRYLPEIFAGFERLQWTSSPDFSCQIAPINDNFNTGDVAGYQPDYELLKQLHSLFPDWEATRSRYRVYLGYFMEKKLRILRKAIFDTDDEHYYFDLSGCSASRLHNLVFGADGLLYPCVETVGFTDYSIGSYLQGLQLNEEKWQRWHRDIAVNDKCSQCNLAPLCGGGCVLKGSSDGELRNFEASCSYTRQYLKTYLDLHRERLLESYYQ